MRHLAIIPIQKKQVQELLKLHDGKPIIAHCIETVIRTKLFDEVIVYTQDEQISRIAKYYRANTPFPLGSETIQEDSNLTQMLLDVMASYKSRGVLFKYACSINPFTKYLEPKQIKAAYQKLQKEKLDTILPITSYKYPIQKAFRFIRERVQMMQSEYVETDTDTLETYYHDCEQFYWFNTAKLNANKSLFTKNTGGFIVPEKEKKIINQAYLQASQIKHLYENNYNFQG
jgi:N-acylneuraminate cytidylyltransferase